MFCHLCRNILHGTAKIAGITSLNRAISVNCVKKKQQPVKKYVVDHEVYYRNNNRNSKSYIDIVMHMP